ncbi:MAG TPA: F0F1 ATP synthase subunit epsilon [Streptosporangiaceae bacterium]|nr:F0F1 ATP synthase subunit epsilon [Streptosporangiaceae bacterium]
MTLHVMLVVPEGQVWAGNAERVVAKTLDGDIGILTGHTPVLGILAAGSVVRILPERGTAGGSGASPPGASTAGSGWVQAAVGGGFLSVADDKVSILARQAVLGADVDKSAVRSELDSAGTGPGTDEDENKAAAAYLAAQLRAAGEQDQS